MASKVFSVALALAMIALILPSAFAQTTTFRHQFQYDLKPEFEGKVGEIIQRWTGFAEKAPAAGKPTLYQFGKDLGISSKLYNLATNTQVDFAGRLDFPSEAALRAFWAVVSKDPLWIEMTDKWVKTSYRVQYLTHTCTYPAPGTYFRHTFEYQPKPSASCGASVSTESGPAGGASVSSADVQRITRAWVKFCQDAPAKPVSCVFGADLGLGKELYPGKSNLAFGGSLDFKSEADMTTFWRWIVNQPEYKDVTKDNLVAARIQYMATFK